MGDPTPMDQALENTLTSLSPKRAKSPGELTYTCEKCGRVNEPVEFNLLGREHYVRRKCPCEIQEVREYEMETEKARRLQELMSLAALGPTFTECTFEAFELRPGTKQAYFAAKRYTETFDVRRESGEGLLLYGRPGSGKSHLAAAIVNTLIADQVRAVFRSVPELLRKLRETYSGGPLTEGDVLRVLTISDLLVLDDAGAEKHTNQEWGWREEMLYTIIDERYRWKRPVIVTSNCDLADLEARLGTRTFDRLLERCVMVENKGTSYRRMLAEERMKREV